MRPLQNSIDSDVPVSLPSDDRALKCTEHTQTNQQHQSKYYYTSTVSSIVLDYTTQTAVCWKSCGSSAGWNQRMCCRTTIRIQEPDARRSISLINPSGSPNNSLKGITLFDGLGCVWSLLRFEGSGHVSSLQRARSLWHVVVLDRPRTQEPETRCIWEGFLLIFLSNHLGCRRVCVHVCVSCL